ncbi:hypothetical protein [Paraburkholderia sp.]|nr:hypothetical protein [Paraburkholderia sp.]
MMIEENHNFGGDMPGVRLVSGQAASAEIHPHAGDVAERRSVAW